MSILRSKHSGWTWEGKRTPFGGGGGDIFSGIGQSLADFDKNVLQPVETVAVPIAAAVLAPELLPELALTDLASADITAEYLGYQGALDAMQNGVTADALGLPANTTINSVASATQAAASQAEIGRAHV